MLGRIRMAIVGLLIVGLVVAGYVGYRLFTEEPHREARISRVTGTTDDGWQQVSYRGVTVELPPDWRRLDTAICDVGLERWASAGQEPLRRRHRAVVPRLGHLRRRHWARRAHRAGVGLPPRRWLERLRHPRGRGRQRHGRGRGRRTPDPAVGEPGHLSGRR